METAMVIHVHQMPTASRVLATKAPALNALLPQASTVMLLPAPQTLNALPKLVLLECALCVMTWLELAADNFVIILTVLVTVTVNQILVLVDSARAAMETVMETLALEMLDVYQALATKELAKLVLQPKEITVMLPFVPQMVIVLQTIALVESA